MIFTLGLQTNLTLSENSLRCQGDFHFLRSFVKFSGTACTPTINNLHPHMGILCLNWSLIWKTCGNMSICALITCSYNVLLNAENS